MENNLFAIHFNEIPDPRLDRCKKHNLLDILGLALMGVICNCDSWTEIEDFGNRYEKDLKKFLTLENGIPSHDTINRVMTKINPEHFQKTLIGWLNSIRKIEGKEIICIDGKEMGQSGSGYNNLGFVQAWSFQRNLFLGGVACKKGGGEVPKIPELLDLFSIKDCIVTADAGNARSSVAKAIKERGGDYLLTIKKNENSLYKKIFNIFDGKLPFENVDWDEFSDGEYGHGRMSFKYSAVISTDSFAHLDMNNKWPDLKTIGMIENVRIEDGGLESTQRRFYISSLNLDAKNLLEKTKAHWSIENNLHWILDIAFLEDDDRKREQVSATNMAMLRRFAVSIMKKKKDQIKMSYNRLRKNCSWDFNLFSDLISDK